MRKSDITNKEARQECQMYEEIAVVEIALWLGLPAWIANAVPVILGGGRPIDGGRRFRDGRRILGDGKTIRGFVSGVVLGTATGIVQGIVAPWIPALLDRFIVVTNDMIEVIYIRPDTAFLLSFGALVGDLVGSFIKRRVGLRSGGPAPVLDQLGFIVMALIMAAPVIQPAYQYVSVLVILTLIVHYLSNVGGYLLGYKRHPW